MVGKDYCCCQINRFDLRVIFCIYTNEFLTVDVTNGWLLQLGMERNILSVIFWLLRPEATLYPAPRPLANVWSPTDLVWSWFPSVSDSHDEQT